MSKEKQEYRKLTKEEENVIVDKGTEAPFTGKYFAFWERGTYVCKRCGAKLYRSENKFEAGRMLVGLLVGTLLATLPPGAIAEDSFQMNALFSPSQAQLRAEARGHIMIYDSLDEQVVERALDEQYERIENMMFTRIRHAEPDGDVSVEDDGC